MRQQVSLAAPNPAPAVPAATRDTSRPVPFGRAARAVFRLALEGMVWTKRSLLMAVLLALPVAFAILYRVVLAARLPSAITPSALYESIVAVYYVGNVLPLAALFYATALIADEVEGRTITYLFTRPIHRAAILTGKFGAYVATTLSMVFPALVVTYFLLLTVGGLAAAGGRAGDLARDLGVVALALLVYGALFTLLGVLTRRPVIPGLLFLFVWELAANLPGYLPRVTVTAYLRSLLPYRVAQGGVFGLVQDVLPLAVALPTLAGLLAAFLAAAFWIFSTREYVLDQ
jgi:ABC-2 type transport system permease protein